MLYGERFDGRQKGRMPAHGKRVEQTRGFVVRQIGRKILQAMAGKKNDGVVITHAPTGTNPGP